MCRTVVEYTRFSENAIIPKKSTSRSAAIELYAAENVMIPANGKAVVSTDIRIKLPPGTCGVIMSCSG